MSFLRSLGEKIFGEDINQTKSMQELIANFEKSFKGSEAKAFQELDSIDTGKRTKGKVSEQMEKFIVANERNIELTKASQNAEYGYEYRELTQKLPGDKRKILESFVFADITDVLKSHKSSIEYHEAAKKLESKNTDVTKLQDPFNYMFENWNGNIEKKDKVVRSSLVDENL